MQSIDTVDYSMVSLHLIVQCKLTTSNDIAMQFNLIYNLQHEIT